jgi:hypothetical protein
LVHSPTLSLPAAQPTLAASVFARLTINDGILSDPSVRLGKGAYSHCGIEAVMASVQVPTMDYSDVLKATRRMVEALACARREELAKSRYEKKIDECAHWFLVLNGFADDPFTLTPQASDFTIFGKMCYSSADAYVVVSSTNDLVLVFEDKSLPQGSCITHQGHLGQIIGELLQMLSRNRDGKVFRTVFAVRLVNYFVTTFRVDVDKQTLETLVQTDFVPKNKLRLHCSDPSPQTNRGLSLIDAAERARAVQLMASMRQFIIDAE